VARVLHGPELYPAQAVKPGGELLWMLDKDAAKNVQL